ncbi:putative PIF1 helicase-like protein [Trypanosoma grayi]|uniref:putative PIF1 helicase-like protein n=1 Tax=Trypanosoma grayi TaxID=71804 RepID=UPI0004F41371|nr:putative PIF1 helicase-like protein [Trypanosoma grayi]KEG12447.1 putative PIF1 helicase-like protein [Trypanosoma grayi]
MRRINVAGLASLFQLTTSYHALRRRRAAHSVRQVVTMPRNRARRSLPSGDAVLSQPLQEACMSASEGSDAFINPFTGRLTPASSRVAKELLRVGFKRSAVNPFRIVWDAAAAQTASPNALRPFLNSIVSWRKNLTALLSRPDAADAVNEEIHRLYGELTSAYLPPKLDAMHDPQLSSMTMTPDQENAIRCAIRGYSMFVGGSAGTGKTVLLKAIHRRLTELGLRVAMTATTGVASVQLGGCTFHLAFGVPLSDATGLKKRWDANALRAVDVVIIDEVSLLDAELFDAFDLEARMARLEPLPFGGLQVIACGDFLQLATTDSASAGPCYQSAAFRHLIAVQLVTPMRHAQGDPLYKMLAQLRVGKFDRKVFASLDRPLSENTENVTHIFPRRRDAQRLNDEKLCELRSEEMIFTPQRGPLQLIGNFTSAGLVEFRKRKHLPNRDEIVEVMTEEIKRIAGVDVADHNVVVMPTRSAKGGVIIRLRHPDDGVAARKGIRSGGSSNFGISSTAVSKNQWKEIMDSTASRLKATLRQVYDEDPQGFVPLSVSMALADVSSHPNAEHLTPLRLKLGCRVMVNRNLSRTVSNGSVGVVEAFALPNPDLFPRRHEAPAKTFYGWLLEKNMFPNLPIVRLLSGEVVQVPPLSLTVGGTPSTFFYGHELYSLPLQLGYSFTVHKVQGLTLEGTVVLDCEKFFECPHLIYVACSRVRSLDQLIVKNIRSDMVIVKRSALEFSKKLKDASIMTNFAPSDGCTRASWVERQSPRLMGLTE